MTNYIKENYKYVDCIRMAHDNDMLQSEMYVKCIELVQNGEIERKHLKISDKFEFTEDMENHIIKYNKLKSRRELAEDLGMKIGRMQFLVSIMKEAGLLGKREYRKKLSMNEVDDRIEKEDREHYIKMKRANEKYIRENKHKVGEVFEAYITGTTYKEKIKVKVKKVYPRFCLCESEQGFNVCVPLFKLCKVSNKC